MLTGARHLEVAEAPWAEFDLTAARWTIDAERFASKSRNCPFHGWEVTGAAVATIVGGEVKWQRDR